MRRKIGCLHAHYSNITYIEQALSSFDLELVHYVDPGLINRMTIDPSFDEQKAKDKVTEQLQWIMGNQVDAILITCTNYIALLDEDRLQSVVPIIKIDEPYFAELAESDQPQALLFTNPATVEGTMRRLTAYSEQQGLALQQLEPRVIPHTFELIMQGKEEAYEIELCTYIRHLHAANPGIRISVAQLSMVNAANRMEHELDIEIGNPLKPLVNYLRLLY